MTTTELLEIPLDDVQPGNNDRVHFDDDELLSLSQSIAEIGLAEPILVRPTPDAAKPYTIIGGERRWRAHFLPPCRRAGLTTISATVRHDLTDATAAALMLAENTARVNLGIMEEARAYGARRAAGVSVARIAREAGVAEFRVKWRLDMLDVIPEVQAALDSGQIPSGPALELRKLDNNRQIIGLKAWLANPTMGSVAFRKLCERLALAAMSDNQGGLFADPEAEFIRQAKAIKPKTASMAQLRAMVAALVGELEAHGLADTTLVERARAMY